MWQQAGTASGDPRPPPSDREACVSGDVPVPSAAADWGGISAACLQPHNGIIRPSATPLSQRYSESTQCHCTLSWGGGGGHSGVTARPSSALTLRKSCDYVFYIIGQNKIDYKSARRCCVRVLHDSLKYYKLHHTNSFNDPFVSIQIHNNKQCGSCDTCDDVHMTLSFFAQGSHVFLNLFRKRNFVLSSLRRTQNVMQVHF